MSATIDDLIRRAISKLRLRDIVLYESHFGRAAELTMESVSEGLQQSKRGVKFTVAEKSGDESAKLLQILISLGVRVVANESAQAEQAEPLVLFFIEADFLVVYEITGDLDDDEKKAFAEFNAVHNVWPFWRQHVYDIVQRARLPHLDIPLFSGKKP